MTGWRLDNLTSKRTTAQAASVVMNAVTNATITATAATAGGAGNSITVAFVTGAPTINVALAAAESGNAVTVTLGTDGAGVLDDTKNTGTLVVAALNGLTKVTAATSGTGAGIVAPVAAKTLASGHDVWTIPVIARIVNSTDERIAALEHGDNCTPNLGQRIADALGVTLAALGSAL